MLPPSALDAPSCWLSPAAQGVVLAVACGVFLLGHLLLTRKLRARLAEGKRALKAKTAEWEKAQESLQQLCLTDPLTGLPNQRYINVSLPEDASQSLRAYRSYLLGLTDRPPTNADVVLMRVDIDQFAAIADEHGLAASDQVLVQMKDILQRSSRGSDAVIRLGNAPGFLVVARKGSRGEAKALAERIRKATEEHTFEIGEGRQIHCTCSQGASAYPFLVEEPVVVGWERVLALVEACTEALQKRSRGQWILLLPSPELRSELLRGDLSAQAPALIKDGHLSVLSSLESPEQLDWKA